jgi:acylphosphatase
MVAGFRSAPGRGDRLPVYDSLARLRRAHLGRENSLAMQDATRIRQRLIVRGRVQGVAFRYATREKARALGVDGWVCNRPDGSVEAVLEGEPERVAKLAAFCRMGPPAARVDRVEEHSEEPEGLRGFAVR